LKLVFCGTPEFAVPTLEALHNAGHEIALVLTQPDRPAGRKLTSQAPPIKEVAMKYGLQVFQPEKVKTNLELQEMLQTLQPDAIAVVAYGRIIPKWMLDLPRFGNINLHGSLLPKYRGAAPIQWAVANGETETGVATMWLDEGLDTGDVLLEQRLPIGPDATSSQLYPQLARIGSELMVETLARLESGTLARKPQDHSQATLAPILTREDGRIDFAARNAREIYDRWRGFYPWPGAYAAFRGKRFLVHRMHVGGENLGLACGQLDWSEGELVVGAAEGTALILDEVQLEGKQQLTGIDFVRGFQLKQGESLAS
jgi:methionyl-tRNA formyltransferase